jgi:starch phosphorylase
MIRDDYFSPDEPGIFRPIFDNLIHHGDYYCLLADFKAYIQMQEEVSETYRDADLWTKKSILNVARMGRFSSDYTIHLYARDIWNVQPVPIQNNRRIIQDSDIF